MLEERGIFNMERDVYAEKKHVKNDDFVIVLAPFQIESSRFAHGDGGF